MEKKIEDIANALKGLKQYEWVRVKQQVDILYSSKAAKVELDDSKLLEKNIRREFNC